MVIARQMTAEEFIATPAPRRRRPWNLVDGEVVVNVWLVDTSSASILVFRRSTLGTPGFDAALELSRSDRLRSPLLPEFALDVGEVFPPGRDQPG